MKTLRIDRRFLKDYPGLAQAEHSLRGEVSPCDFVLLPIGRNGTQGCCLLVREQGDLRAVSAITGFSDLEGGLVRFLATPKELRNKLAKIYPTLVIVKK